MAQKKLMGLVLTLGGAPNTWHSVNGFDGLYHPSIPVLLDDVGVHEEQAQAAHANEGCPLALVEVKDEAASREALQQALLDSARGAVSALRSGEVVGEHAEERFNQERAAVAPAQEA